jgi:molecular chaperone DnaK (HSP70)
MIVGSSTSAFNYIKEKKEMQESDIAFALNDEKQTQTQMNEYKSRDEINEEDIALQQFKKDLTQKGAFKFMHDFNMQKIEEMLEEHKKKLEKELEDNPDSKMDIDQMLSEYKKQLLERFRELEDDKDDSKTLMSSSRIAFEMADKLKPKLEDILSL